MKLALRCRLIKSTDSTDSYLKKILLNTHTDIN